MTLAKPPARFTKALSDADARAVARWWSALAEGDRRADEANARVKDEQASRIEGMLLTIRSQPEPVPID